MLPSWHPLDRLRMLSSMLPADAQRTPGSRLRKEAAVNTQRDETLREAVSVVRTKENGRSAEMVTLVVLVITFQDTV